MTDPDPFSALETSIYEAAVIPELWPQALAEVSEASWTAGAVLVCVNERGVQTTTSPNMQEVGRRFIDEGWMSRNTRAQELVAKGFVGAPHFVTEEDIFEPGLELTDPMINELFRPYGFGRGAGMIVELPHGDTVIVSIEQYWDRGHVRGKSLDTLNRLYPHLARGALLAGRSDFRRISTAVEMLTTLGIPAVAITSTGRVVLANALFEASTHVWDTRGGDKLVLHDKAADKMLADAVQTIVAAESLRSIPLRETAGGPVGAVLQIAPIRRAAHDIFGSCVAIAVLSEPKADARQATLVQSLFDLTAQELSVAKGISSGLSVAEIARQSGRSVHTIRNQLSAVLSKTGVSRQAEIVVLMNQLAGRF